MPENLVFEPPIGQPIARAFDAAHNMQRKSGRRVACRLGFVAYIFDGSKTAAEMVSLYFQNALLENQHDPVLHPIRFNVTGPIPNTCPQCHC